MTPEMEGKMIKALEKIAEALETLSELACDWWNMKYGR